MSPLVETVIIFRRELRKNFRSAKGIALAVLTLLVGSGIALAWAKFVGALLEAAGQQGTDHIAAGALAAAYGIETAEWLSKAPLVLLGLLQVTIWLTPLLVALMGFDSISGDLQHRTLRYWTLRSRRVSYFVAKWAGLWATVAAVCLLLDIVMWIVCISKDGVAAGTVFSWGLRFWAVSVPICAVWSAIAVVVSAVCRTPIVALLVTFVTFFSMWVASLVFGFLKVEPLVYLNPNFFDRLMVDPRPERFFGGVAACLAIAAVCVAGGTAILYRRDV